VLICDVWHGCVLGGDLHAPTPGRYRQEVPNSAKRVEVQNELAIVVRWRRFLSPLSDGQRIMGIVGLDSVSTAGEGSDEHTE
jgi:hypothetical protein